MLAKSLATAALLVIGGLLPLTAAPAHADSDPAEFKALKSRYEDAARKRDDDDNRLRTNIVLEFFDYLDQKSCRKLLLGAYADERMWIDCRVAAVQVLGACGDPKSLDKLVSLYKKEKHLAPVIALGEGLSYTDPELHAETAKWVLKRLPKAKEPELRLALLEGLGALENAGAFDELVKLASKLSASELFEVYIGMGIMGGERAVPELEKALGHPDVRTRLGATIGLTRCSHESRFPVLIRALGDFDPRVRETAAKALGAAAHEPAAAVLTELLEAGGLREREVARTALRAILKKDCGHDAKAWRTVIDGKPAPNVDLPVLPKAFGVEIPSDNVILLLDTSRSMNWNDRLSRAQSGLAEYLKQLPDDALFNISNLARDPKRFSEKGLVSAVAQREDGVTWIEEQLTGGWLDMKATLRTLIDENPQADTIVIATDSQPWGTGRAETPMETIEVFRQANRQRQIRVHIVMTVPGGRYVKSENSEIEWQNRIDNLTLLAETSGGTFTLLDE